MNNFNRTAYLGRRDATEYRQYSTGIVTTDRPTLQAVFEVDGISGMASGETGLAGGILIGG